MKEEAKELTKDRECIHCKNFLRCMGKPRGTRCINFIEGVWLKNENKGKGVQ